MARGELGESSLPPSKEKAWPRCGPWMLIFWPVILRKPNLGATSPHKILCPMTTPLSQGPTSEQEREQSGGVCVGRRAAWMAAKPAHNVSFTLRFIC